MRMLKRANTRQPFVRVLGALSALMLLCTILPVAGCTGLFRKPFDARPFYASKDNPRNEPGILSPGIKEAGLHSAADVTGYYANSAVCLKEWVVRSNPFEVVPEITADSVYPEPSLRDYVTAYPEWGNPLLLTDHYYFVSHTAPGAAVFVVELRQMAPNLVHADIYAGTKFTRTPESIAATVLDGLKHCESESSVASDHAETEMQRSPATPNSPQLAKKRALSHPEKIQTQEKQHEVWSALAVGCPDSVVDHRLSHISLRESRLPRPSCLRNGAGNAGSGRDLEAGGAIE